MSTKTRRFYWLRLMTDFFSQPKIKKMRKDCGDTCVLIYLKMQLSSLKNDGILAFEGIEDDFANEIALTLDEEVENARTALEFMLAQGMILDNGDDTYCLPETQGLIGSEGMSAERMRNYRERHKKMSQCDNDVTQPLQVGDVEKEKREEIREETKEEEIVAQICLSDGTNYEITGSQSTIWQQAYPDLNVRSELLQAAAWCKANPTRRKSRAGIERFIVSWLGRSQKQKNEAEVTNERKHTESNEIESSSSARLW